jgi:hypothetical protein
MAKQWAAVLAVVLSAVATVARAQPPATLPMPAQLTRPEQAPPPAPEQPAAPAAAVPGGPGCAGGCCGHEQVGCLKRLCNWLTYHPLTRGCECVCGCGCCSDCCGYHGFQPLYTYLQLPCQEGPRRSGPAAQPGCACGGHGLLFKWGLCQGCHGGPIVPPGIE